MSEENGTILNDEYDEWMVYRIDEDSVAHGYVIARTPSEALAVYEEQCSPDLGYGLGFHLLEIRLLRPNEEIEFRWEDVTYDDDVQGDPRVTVDRYSDYEPTAKATAATWADRYGRCGGAPVTLCFSEW